MPMIRLGSDKNTFCTIKHFRTKQTNNKCNKIDESDSEKRTKMGRGGLKVETSDHILLECSVLIDQFRGRFENLTLSIICLQGIVKLTSCDHLIERICLKQNVSMKPFTGGTAVELTHQELLSKEKIIILNYNAT